MIGDNSSVRRDTVAAAARPGGGRRAAAGAALRRKLRHKLPPCTASLPAAVAHGHRALERRDLPGGGQRGLRGKGTLVPRFAGFNVRVNLSARFTRLGTENGGGKTVVGNLADRSRCPMTGRRYPAAWRRRRDVNAHYSTAPRLPCILLSIQQWAFILAGDTVYMLRGAAGCS